jgi:uncharacterized membrane protein
MRVEEQFRVEAPAAAAWAVLADVESWPEWTASMSTVDVVQGPMGPGARVRVKQPRFPAMTWNVTDWEPGEGFTWTASSAGVHTVASHRIEPAGDGSLVTLSIDQRGPLAWLVALLAGGTTRRYVAMEAAGLKARAESAARSQPAAVDPRAAGQGGG